MSKLTNNSSSRKITSFFIVFCMILPTLNVSAEISGITYYQHNFELPLYGATGCAVRDYRTAKTEK